MKALDVCRERLHELESERLGLTDVCRYETTMAGKDEEEQTLTAGDRSNPIPREGAGHEQPQQPRPRSGHARDPDPMNYSNDKSEKSGSVAPIVELLRKRQRKEREEADIRREEHVLLNKRLAMMEEQVRTLSRLITQRARTPHSQHRRLGRQIQPRARAVKCLRGLKRMQEL